MDLKPLIGITSYYIKDRELGKDRDQGLIGQDMLLCTMDNIKCIEKSGGIPIPIPVFEDNDEYITEIIERLDGILLTGGSDIHPEEYGQDVKIGLGTVVPERDIFELKLCKKALELNKPILGICRGLQIINVFFGGTLYQDLKETKFTTIEHRGTMLPKFSYCHSINVDTNSKIYTAFGRNKIMVNSFHHQGVDKIGDGLKKTAWAEDGMVEGIEHIDYPFVVGVQWHPEAMVDKYEEHLKLFRLFVNEVKILKLEV
ncbi:hypothetical protein Gferi_13980 [Geosporobacter ferrireducens]|uniref:Uncharacterized protein n=1 Tax=Geosporobacter ferrireducens TaxID=1424294 RepID=A0A1D8GI59_9FIRM|nr:hypothetical protein Gferi_13980 [Geosporobacter ferrireducens]